MKKRLIAILLIGSIWGSVVQAAPYKEVAVPPFELINAAIVSTTDDSDYENLSIKRYFLGYTGSGDYYTVYYTKLDPKATPSRRIISITLARLNTGIWVLQGSPAVIVQE